jgi:hypothetical protein
MVGGVYSGGRLGVYIGKGAGERHVREHPYACARIDAARRRMQVMRLLEESKGV